MFDNAERKLSNVIVSSTGNFKKASKAAEKMICKNLLFSFIASLVLFAAAIGGYLYIQNYRDGSKIAEEKAVEALAAERTKLENDLAYKKKQIEQAAVASYKKSSSYREDACKLVASNISKVDCMHYMYLYIKSDDIINYEKLQYFYNEYLKSGHEQYKEIVKNQ